MSSLVQLVDQVSLEVSIYHNARVCGHWEIHEHSEGDTCFHMATQGSCVLQVPDHGRWVLGEGDLVIFPREIPHTMVSGELLEGRQRHLLIADSQDVSGTSMLCGQLRFRHQGSQPLLNALPAVLVIERDESSTWLTHLYALIIEESLTSRQPSNPILNRLCELLVSYALRHFAEHDHRSIGILTLFAHKNISKAIDAIHEAPSKDWGLVNMAECAGMSRTSFAQIFKKLSGWTPMQYLSWWRLQLAWNFLRAGEPVSIVAEKVGYQSEAAFSRAFKRLFGEAAGAVRRAGKRQ